MTFQCKDSNNVVRNVTWIYRENAWIPVVTVCRYNLYPVILTPRPTSDNSIPDVTGLNLELENLGLIISWTNNSTYFTEITTSVDESEWNSYTIDQNQNTFVFDAKVGTSIQIRARFTDDQGNFSKNYATATMTIWDIADVSMYGLTEYGTPDFLGNTLYDLNLGNENLLSNKVKTFLEEDIVENNYALTAQPFDNGLLFRLVYRNRDNYSGVEFETINLVNDTIQSIPLSYADEFSLCDVTAMCYNSGSYIFYAYSNCGFYQIDPNGAVTRLTVDDFSANKGLAPYNSDFLTLYNDNGTVGVYAIDTANGQRTTAQWTASAPINNYTITAPHSLTNHNGLLYAVFAADELVENGYSGLILITIDINEEEILFVSRLAEGNYIIASVMINGQHQLVIQNTNTGNVSLLSTTGEIGDVVANTSRCCNVEERQSMAFNPIDRHIYHSSMRVEGYDQETNINNQMEFNFEKLNTDTMEVTQISTSGDVFVKGILKTTNSYIADGGNDMFNDGNFLNTNIIEDGFIEYTHTRQSDGDVEDFVEIADGTVQDGTPYFGAGSEYFTNMYSNLFVMVAKDIDINSFTISGELGAGGDGTASQETITLNNGHTGYLKKVYGAGDPTVNHLVIVPSGQNITSSISKHTNFDFHQIEGLGNTSYIYYLLFSTVQTEVTSNMARTIGNSFLSAISGENTTGDILLALNANINQVTSSIVDANAFTDYNYGTGEYFIGRKQGLRNPRCMAYRSDNTFLVVGDNASLYSIDTNGVITYINNLWHLYDCSSLAFVGNTLYAAYDSVANLTELDPNTGEILSQVEDKKGPIVWIDSNNITSYSIKGMTAIENSLYIISYDGNQTYTLAVIENLIPNEYNILFATSIGQAKITGGLTVETFGSQQPAGSYFWDYTEDTTRIEVGPLVETLDIENLEVQWHPSPRADRTYSGWEDVEILETINYNEGWWYVIINKSSSDYMIRMRYKNPVSKWTYYELD